MQEPLCSSKMEFESAMEALSKRFGRFHLVTLSLISMIYIFQALFYLSYVFTTLRSDHRYGCSDQRAALLDVANARCTVQRPRAARAALLVGAGRDIVANRLQAAKPHEPKHPNATNRTEGDKTGRRFIACRPFSDRLVPRSIFNRQFAT